MPFCKKTPLATRPTAAAAFHNETAPKCRLSDTDMTQLCQRVTPKTQSAAPHNIFGTAFVKDINAWSSGHRTAPCRPCSETDNNKNI